VWNEPYRFGTDDGFTDTVWMFMSELVTTVRATGNTNILLIPCAEQGQDESILINKGADFLKTKPTFYLIFMLKKMAIRR
jgi:mannan endo-1,4-beta-mannosidase